MEHDEFDDDNMSLDGAIAFALIIMIVAVLYFGYHILRWIL